MGDQCFKVGSKYEIFSLPADSPAAKHAFAAYNTYAKPKRREKAAEEERPRKEAAEERKNLLSNPEAGMYLAHHAGQGLGHVYVVGRVDRIEHRKAFSTPAASPKTWRNRPGKAKTNETPGPQRTEVPTR